MKREERFKKDWAFKRLFYAKLDAILARRRFEFLDEMYPEIEHLVALDEQIDGKTVYQPLRHYDSIKIDLRDFLYGLEHWRDIRQLLIESGGVKGVDIINSLDLDRKMTSNFLYRLDKIGILKKSKSGKYNVFSYVTDQLNDFNLVNGWHDLFDTSKRFILER